MREKSLVFAASLVFTATLVLSGCKSSRLQHRLRPIHLYRARTRMELRLPQRLRLQRLDQLQRLRHQLQRPGLLRLHPAPAPVAAAPPPPPEPVKLTAPSGAAVVVTVTEQLSASKNNVGDGFTGVLAQSVKTAGGATVFPRGAHVVGTVVAAKGQGKFKGSGALGIQVTSISGNR